MKYALKAKPVVDGVIELPDEAVPVGYEENIGVSQSDGPELGLAQRIYYLVPMPKQPPVAPPLEGDDEG